MTNERRGHIAGPFAAFREWPRLCVLLSVFCGAVTSGLATAKGNTVNPLHYFGHLNDDGHDDVLLRHTDGRWYYYPMDGREHIGGQRGIANLTTDLDWAITTPELLQDDGMNETSEEQMPLEVYNDNLIILSLEEMPLTSAELDIPAYAREIYRRFDDALVSFDDIIAEHGARVPDHTNSQKHYRAAAVMLIDQDHSATPEVKHLMSEHVETFSHQGSDDSGGFNCL